jgi:aromatic ring-cleaving dioxygenase
MPDPAAIQDYHAHVYFDAGSREAARRIRDGVTARFAAPDRGAVVGRWHERTVGPHPRWSFQVAFGPALFDSLVPWLLLNREDLTVFIHPNTGDALADHTEHAAWLGPSVALDIDFFRRQAENT